MLSMLPDIPAGRRGQTDRAEPRRIPEQWNIVPAGAESRDMGYPESYSSYRSADLDRKRGPSRGSRREETGPTPATDSPLILHEDSLVPPDGVTHNACSESADCVCQVDRVEPVVIHRVL